jgi:hypothetical protein
MRGKQEELLKGGKPYIVWLRTAARQARLDIDHFDAMQACLSSYTHSTPVSFFRPGLGLDEVDPVVAPRLVFCVAGLALEYIEGLLGMACERMFDLYPELFLKGQTRHYSAAPPCHVPDCGVNGGSSRPRRSRSDRKGRKR